MFGVSGVLTRMLDTLKQHHLRANGVRSYTYLWAVLALVSVTVGISAAPAGPDSVESSAPAILFRIHVAHPADAEPSQGEPQSVVYRGQSWRLDVAPALVVSATDVEKARAEYGLTTVQIAFTVGKDTSEAFTALTGEHAGGYLAMMHGDSVVSVAKVPGAIASPVLQTMALLEDAEGLLTTVRDAGIALAEERPFEKVEDQGVLEAAKLLEQGDLQGAIKAYRGLVESVSPEDPRHLSYQLVLARLLMQARELEQAKDQLDQIVVLPITAVNREMIFSAFVMCVDMMEGLNQYPLRNIYLKQALTRLGELEAQEGVDPKVRAWAQLSAGFLHLRYMDLKQVDAVLTDQNRESDPDLWHTLAAYHKELLGDVTAAKELYQQWLEARPDQAEAIRVRLHNLELGRPNIARSRMAQAMDQAAAAEEAKDSEELGSGEETGSADSVTD